MHFPETPEVPTADKGVSGFGTRQMTKGKRSEGFMGSAGVDFAVAFEAFLKWLSVTFGGGIGIG